MLLLLVAINGQCDFICAKRAILLPYCPALCQAEEVEWLLLPCHALKRVVCICCQSYWLLNNVRIGTDRNIHDLRVLFPSKSKEWRFHQPFIPPSFEATFCSDARPRNQRQNHSRRLHLFFHCQASEMAAAAATRVQLFSPQLHIKGQTLS